jgi:hypothetical protein
MAIASSRRVLMALSLALQALCQSCFTLLCDLNVIEIAFSKFQCEQLGIGFLK